MVSLSGVAPRACVNARLLWETGVFLYEALTTIHTLENKVLSDHSLAGFNLGGEGEIKRNEVEKTRMKVSKPTKWRLR